MPLHALLLPLVLAATRQPSISLLSVSSSSPSASSFLRFAPALEQIRDAFATAAEALAAQEQQSTEGAPAASLASLSNGVATLRRVRAEVASADAAMPPDVRMQVAWDIDRMVADAERLRTQSLAPIARAALMKALQLRFGVLLTPAFWTTPIKRDLILADDVAHGRSGGSSGGAGAAGAEVEEAQQLTSAEQRAESP